MNNWARGNHAMRPGSLGLSLMVSWFSIISYTAIPGEMVAHGPWLWLGLAAAPVVLGFVACYFIPYIRLLDAYQLVTRGRVPANPYQYLSHIGCAGLATSIFVLMRCAWMALIVHVAGVLVLEPVTGVDALYWQVGLVAATAAWCTLGFRWVVWLDAVQAGVMFAGAIAVLITTGLMYDSPVLDWPDLVWFAPWGRVSIIPCLLSATALGLAVKCGDAMNLQRFLAARSNHEARQTLLNGFAADVTLTGLLCLVGLALASRYTGGPADRFLLDYLVSMPLHAGWIVVAAMLSAAMSSLSSGVHAVVCAVGGER